MIEIINTCFATTNEVRPVAYYAHLVPLAIGVCISLFVISKNKITSLTGSFFAFVLFFNLWLIGDLITWVSNDYHLINASWQTLDFINIVAFLSAVFFFDIYALGKVADKKKIFLLLLAVPALAIVLQGQAITGFQQSFCESIENEFMTMYKIIVEGIAMLLIVITAFKAWASFDSKKKKATLIICTSLLAFLTIFATTEYWATQFDIYEISLYGLFALPIFQLMIMLSTSQFGTFNLKSWNQQLLGFVLVIMIASQLFFLKNSTDLALNIFTLFISFFLAFFLSRSIRREIKIKKELEELADNLEKANVRLQELDQQKSEFISLASHQLRGPLTAIKGYASLVIEGDYGALPKEAKDAIETIYHSTQAMVVLVSDYLDVSRIEQGKMKYDFSDFDLKQLVQTVIHELTPTVEMAHLSLDFDFNKEEDLFVHADEGKIKQVISNLIDNATKYTKQGNIWVSIKRNEKDNILLSVKDTGVGIPVEVIPRLFEKFIRAPDANKANIMGTGLGLYVAKKMIEAHRGKIWAESPGKDQGSTFFIELDPLHSHIKPKFEEAVNGKLSS